MAAALARMAKPAKLRCASWAGRDASIVVVVYGVCDGGRPRRWQIIKIVFEGVFACGAMVVMSVYGGIRKRYQRPDRVCAVKLAHKLEIKLVTQRHQLSAAALK